MIAATLEIGPELRAAIELMIGAFLVWRVESVRRQVASELKPNGGSSARDAIDALHARLDAHGVPRFVVDRPERRLPDPPQSTNGTPPVS